MVYGIKYDIVPVMQITTLAIRNDKYNYGEI